MDVGFSQVSPFRLSSRTTCLESSRIVGVEQVVQVDADVRAFTA